MKAYLYYLLFMLSISTSNAQTQETMNTEMPASKIMCKLTTPALQQRKMTVISDLKKLVSKKEETENGFRYHFEGSDKMIDLLTEFIKTERMCCSFFQFKLTIASDGSFCSLELSGPEGTKDFIRQEIEF